MVGGLRDIVRGRRDGVHSARDRPSRQQDEAIRTHDNVAADIDGDGRLDVVAMSDQAGVVWYQIPQDATQKWLPHRIGPGVHGGVAPRGVGDLDGDGDNDIVRSTGWYENADGKGTKWAWHETIGGGSGGRYKDTTKREQIVNQDDRCHEGVAGDVDGDGDIDICSKPWNGDLHIYLENTSK